MTYLYESYVPAVTLFAAGLVCFVLAGRRERRSLFRLAWMLMVLGVAVGVATYRVTTPGETLTQRTRSLIDHAVEGKTDPLRDMLDEKVLLVGPTGDSWIAGRETLFSTITTVVGRYHVASQQIDDLSVTVESEQRGTANVDIKTKLNTSQVGSLNMKSRWRLTWVDDGGTWRVTRIQWLDHPDPNGLKPTHGIWN